MREGRTARRALGALVLAAALGAPALGAPRSADAEEPRVVPVPTVVHVPAEVGIRGGPHGATFVDPETFGYVEEEFFIEGEARSYGSGPAEDAFYRTRIYVLRPADPERFNGTVVAEWNNVTGQIDASPVWYVAHEHLVREGYAFVGVAAQRAGHEPSPLALKPHDPVRYGDLHHPGDEYSFDMFSQAGQAILFGDPSPLAGYPVERLVAVGQSQSGSRLGAYLRDVHRSALRGPLPGRAGDAPHRARPHPHERRVFDGVMPMTAGTGSAIPTDLVPIIWVNEVRAAPAQPDGELLRVIEIAGAPHFSWWGLRAGQTAGERNRHHDLPTTWDRENAAQYGEQGGGPCPQGYFPDRFAYHAAIDHMDRWLRTGVAPEGWPRLERDGNQLVLDEHGNTRGGFRLPVVDVPVATYRSCALFGETVPLDPLTMAALYPTHEHYMAQMQAAVDDAVADGRLLPPDAEELLARAEASLVGTSPVLLPGLPSL